MGVAKDLSLLIKDYKVIVDKSTVPVGTAEKVHKVIAENLSSDLFDVVSNPEFLREGVAVEDFLKPDRVVIGASSDRARKSMRQLYEPFVRQGNPIIFMDERSAEMTKYAANSYLATRISFMNEIANLCEKVNANVDMVRMGMGSDSRIGKRFLFPGIGYGGSCFPKDVQALAKTADEFEYDFKILHSVMKVNDEQRLILGKKVLEYFNGDVAGKTIAIWGLAFKPNTDDIREAPALYTIDILLDAGAKINVFDPEAMDNVKKIYGDRIQYAQDQYEALINADALAIATEWSLFRTPSFQVMKELLNNHVIVDGRNLYDLEDMGERGFNYYSIGRDTVVK
jgi:UDPglucose 6-dehydrogenase